MQALIVCALTAMHSGIYCPDCPPPPRCNQNVQITKREREVKKISLCLSDREVRLFGRLVATEVRDSFLQLLLPTPELPFLCSHFLFSPDQSLQVF